MSEYSRSLADAELIRRRLLISTASQKTASKKRLAATQLLFSFLADLLERCARSASASELDKLLAAHFVDSFRWIAMEKESGGHLLQAELPPGRWVKREVAKIRNQKARKMLRSKRYAWVQLGDNDQELDALPWEPGEPKPQLPGTRRTFARLFVWSEGPNHPLEDDRETKDDDDATKKRKRAAWLRNALRKAPGEAHAAPPERAVQSAPKGRTPEEIAKRLGLNVHSGNRGKDRQKRKSRKKTATFIA